MLLNTKLDLYMSNELAVELIYKIAHEAKVFNAIYNDSAVSFYEQGKSLTNKPCFNSMLYICHAHVQTCGDCLSCSLQ